MKGILVTSSLLVLTSLTACTRASTDQFRQELQAVKSWTATSKMVADAWVRGAVPTAYTQQTLAKAQQEFQQETDKIAQIESSPAIPETDKLKLLEHIKRLAQITEQMSTAIAQKKHSIVTQQIRDLTLEGRAIDLQKLPQPNP